MRVVEEVLGSNTFSSVDQLIRATDRGDPLHEAVEVLLKGPEVDLGRHGPPHYYDKDHHARRGTRIAWSRHDATTLRDLAIMDSNFQTDSGERYPALPDIEANAEEGSFSDRGTCSYRGDVPMFYGRY